MSNLPLQFTQFIHHPLLPLVFYHFIVLYICDCILCLFSSSSYILISISKTNDNKTPEQPIDMRVKKGQQG